ncbi:CHAP domain-containing protein [Spirosoma oryzicola]|uniref:CHAP domain-containing protein n=1 Tax=Spirosoma oryzicola TaxID=2898794 RepID=UPI001E34CC3F|nr:CHAP domain-containing protein [Spirosoma oryzicola]UHG93287.1 CHAP domain-containing protein [Spirosoma oryzicola]
MSTELINKALAVAASQVGVTEKPLNSNRGPQVDLYLQSVGIYGPASWCAAFVHWCFLQAAKELGIDNPLVKTGGCWDHWRKCESKGAKRYTAAQVAKNPKLLKPGLLFVMDFGKGAGHTGFVLAIDGKRIVTIEGNTNTDGSRNGIGVFKRSRSIASINLGFIDYSGD